MDQPEKVKEACKTFISVLKNEPEKIKELLKPVEIEKVKKLCSSFPSD